MQEKGQIDTQQEFYDLLDWTKYSVPGKNSEKPQISEVAEHVSTYLQNRYNQYISDFPSHVVIFDQLEPYVNSFFEEFGFKKVGQQERGRWSLMREGEGEGKGEGEGEGEGEEWKGWLEGWREGGMEGGMDGGMDGRMDGGRDGWKSEGFSYTTQNWCKS
jgi:hypothetical protein